MSLFNKHIRLVQLSLYVYFRVSSKLDIIPITEGKITFRSIVLQEHQYI